MAPKKGQGGGKSGTPKKPAPSVPDSDHIIFTNQGDSKKKTKKDEGVPPQQQQPPPPPRPDTRKLIGGASWTGKLPVNLLSEHCQREKWNKPEYSMRQVPGRDGADRLYRSSVTLSKTDPKTLEVTTIPPFELPPSHVQLADRPSALEARHFAATYALFRVSSMKNIHMTLPPQYRDLWKGDFQKLKEEDVREERGWKYEADPFAAEAKRQEIRRAMEKRRQNQAKQDAEAVSNLSPPGADRAKAKAWEGAPRLELGQNIRMQMESVIRERSVWNPNAVRLSRDESATVVADLTKLGFQDVHVQEAVECCGVREEALQWLLIHVPEDSLPSWSFPAGYNAGVSLASNDLAKAGKLVKLGMAGYSSELCLQALRENDGDQRKAMEALQTKLVPSPPPPSPHAPASDVEANSDVWKEEMMTLEATLADRFVADGGDGCAIKADAGPGPPMTLHFWKPIAGYPLSKVPLIAIEARDLPSYIRLSATKKAVHYAQQNLLGGAMIYDLMEWLAASMPEIIEHPEKLADLHIAPPSLKLQDPASEDRPRQRNLQKGKSTGLRRDTRSDKEVFLSWKSRQEQAAQQDWIKNRQALPAWLKQSDIVQAVRSRQVTLLTGETGSGKSTQALQFVLDDAIRHMHGASANLICTQPRRVATLALSERVSVERCGKVGDEVGYIIRGESMTSLRTKITFMTTGVLLRRLQSTDGGVKSALRGISHIFVDEVHERSLDTDFLLALLKETLPTLPNVKLVLMSATVDADAFAAYFGGDNVARVHIEGRTHPVHDLYLDDVMRIITNSKKRAQNLSSVGEDSEAAEPEVGKAIQALGIGINFSLIASLVQHIDAELGDASGAILIFLPGTLEIDRCLRALGNFSHIEGLPLHASLTPSEQRRVFRPVSPGKRKVVAATNVAETSITIEDVVAVIDTGKVKETSYDVSSNIVRLQEVWATQAACQQRRGRAGRVRAGVCYKLFTRNVEASMAPRAVPEMLRVPLEQLCLCVKATNSERDVATFLAGTLTPPDSGAIANAIRTLYRMGALEDDRLTGLGMYLGMIPADLRCAKLLVYGAIFACVESCLTIAAILAVKSPFVSPRDKREEAKAARMSFKTSDGDLLLDCAAFDQWKVRASEMDPRGVQDWCTSKFLSQQTLRDIDSTRRQLLDSLIETALIPPEYSSRHTAYNAQSGNGSLLRALIAGALNPQIAAIRLPDKKYIASMTGAKELDPEAKTIKFFNEENGRVFVHPSSVLFDAQSFSGAASFLSYFTKMATTKTFIRDLTRECLNNFTDDMLTGRPALNSYSLLMFGGDVEIDPSGAGLVVDRWLRLRGWARIGALVSRLRAILDNDLRARIDSRAVPGQDHRVFDIVRRLVELNGQDQ